MTSANLEKLAAHALALAALRWHGYRSESRYLVFQALPHTLGMPDAEWRVPALCHDRRNKAEYEGTLEVDNRLLAELVSVGIELQGLVRRRFARPAGNQVTPDATLSARHAAHVR